MTMDSRLSGVNMSIDLEGEYHCTAEWHLAKIANFASILHPFALRISNKSQRFYCSQERLAVHFGVSRATVHRAMKDLVSIGFFERIVREPFSSTTYRVLTHEQWQAAYPGQCVVKQEMPWSSEQGDPLGIRLHNACGGRIKYKPYQLAALRKTGLKDDELVMWFGWFMEHEYSRRNDGNYKWHGRWKGVHRRFLMWIKGDLSEWDLERFDLRCFAEVASERLSPKVSQQPSC